MERIQLSIRLPGNLYKKIKKNSDKEKRSMNAEVIKTLEDYFSKFEKSKKADLTAG